MGRKHCLNLHGTTIILFFHESGINWAGKSLLVRSKILGLFVNTLTAEYTYSRRNMQTFTQQVQTPLSLKQKIFSGFFIAFLKSKWNADILKKKESLLASVFPKLLTPKEKLLKCLKSLTSEQLSVINLLIVGNTAKKSARHYYYPIFPWVWDKLSWKKPALVRPKYVYSAVNVLTNSPNILDLTKTDFSQLNLFQIHGKIG